MPKIVSVSGLPALRTDPRANHYKLIGIEFRTASASNSADALIELGSGGQTHVSDIPHDLILDHCLVTAFSEQPLKRGISLDSSDTTIRNCYIAGFKSAEQDAQAIAGVYGPGPFHIINNYLEASGENLLFGGAPPNIAGLVPSDIEIRGNYLYKQPSWRSDIKNWRVKNLFELKSARRVIFEGNTLENCWRDNYTDDGGYGAINLVATPDSGAWAAVEDVTIRNNEMRHTQNVLNIYVILNIHGIPANNQSGLGITVENNLFWDVSWALYGNAQANDSQSGRGSFIKISQMANVTVNHNTVLQDGYIISPYGPQSPGFVFTNNIVNYKDGIRGENGTQDGSAMASYFPGGILNKNVMIGGNSNNMLACQPKFLPRVCTLR
jgi:hypothetical protein